MESAPIVLVPGFWLGAWAWDEVVEELRGDGCEVTALTLPGRGSTDADRASITLADHVDAICDAVAEIGPPVVLVVHSGTGAAGYGVTERIPEQIGAMVYVDTGPATGPLDPDFTGDELPLPTLDELAEEENLDGLTDEQLETFQQRAVPEPGASLHDGLALTNEARFDVPTTVICTGFTSEQYREFASHGYPFVSGLTELGDVTYIDLPTSHWPMWSRPKELADIIADVAVRVAAIK